MLFSIGYSSFKIRVVFFLHLEGAERPTTSQEAFYLKPTEIK
jgi:hypothetical protein